MYFKRLLILMVFLPYLSFGRPSESSELRQRLRGECREADRQALPVNKRQVLVKKQNEF
jgi:hypothetical protein